MKRKTLRILLTLVMVLSLSLVTAAPVSAAEVTLTATGAPAGNEDTIVVPLAAGTTLGDIVSISWEEWLVAGYPPHVDIILDVDGDTVADDALVFEYAYNNMSHYNDEAPMPYGALTGAWYNTFNDDGNGPAAVTDSSYGWLSSGASGPPGAGSHIAGTLATWKAGTIGAGDRGIDANTIVLRLEIEVDSWVVDSEAKVRNISYNAGSSLGMSVDVPDIVAISVSPTSIDFGTLVPGQISSVFDITVTNIGTHEVDVDADVIGTPLFTVNLELRNPPAAFSVGSTWSLIIEDLVMSASEGLKTQLPVPVGYTPTGVEAATLVFTATGSP